MCVSTTFTCFSLSETDVFVCNEHGTCIAEDNCTCVAFSGYFGIECKDYLCNGVLAKSDLTCSGHGECVKPENCKCELQWFTKDAGALCAEEIVPIDWRLITYSVLGVGAGLYGCVCLITCLIIVIVFALVGLGGTGLGFIVKEQKRKSLRLSTIAGLPGDQGMIIQQTQPVNPVQVVSSPDGSLLIVNSVPVGNVVMQTN